MKITIKKVSDPNYWYKDDIGKTFDAEKIVSVKVDDFERFIYLVDLNKIVDPEDVYTRKEKIKKILL